MRTLPFKTKALEFSSRGEQLCDLLW